MHASCIQTGCKIYIHIQDYLCRELKRKVKRTMSRDIMNAVSLVPLINRFTLLYTLAMSAAPLQKYFTWKVICQFFYTDAKIMLDSYPQAKIWIKFGEKLLMRRQVLFTASCATNVCREIIHLFRVPREGLLTIIKCLPLEAPIPWFRAHTRKIYKYIDAGNLAVYCKGKFPDVHTNVTFFLQFIGTFYSERALNYDVSQAQDSIMSGKSTGMSLIK